MEHTNKRTLNSGVSDQQSVGTSLGLDTYVQAVGAAVCCTMQNPSVALIAKRGGLPHISGSGWRMHRSTRPTLKLSAT